MDNLGTLEERRHEKAAAQANMDQRDYERKSLVAAADHYGGPQSFNDEGGAVAHQIKCLVGAVVNLAATLESKSL